MVQTPDITSQDADAAVPDAGASVQGAAARPRRRLPRLALPKRLPAFKLTRPERIPAADLVLAVGASSLVLSLVFVMTGPARRTVDDRSREIAAQANAATLQLAAESFAAGHQGRYPVDVLELVPYLPAGSAPRNPYTGDRTLFRGAAGDLTYTSRTGKDYVIEAWGPGPDRPCRLVRLQGQASTEPH